MRFLFSGLSLISRDAIVAIPSQRRNSASPLRPFHDQRQSQPQHSTRRGGSVLSRRKKPKKLKSGIYYVDDPHETYRDESEKAQDRIADADYEYYYEDTDLTLANSQPNIGVKYVPVSQITTPPTLTTTKEPYGQIVNKDFYDALSSSRQSDTRTPSSSSSSSSAPVKTARRVADVELDEETKAFPLGNPYYRHPHNYAQVHADSRAVSR